MSYILIVKRFELYGFSAIQNKYYIILYYYYILYLFDRLMVLTPILDGKATSIGYRIGPIWFDERMLLLS